MVSLKEYTSVSLLQLKYRGDIYMGQTIGIDFGTTNTVVSYRNKRDKIVSIRIGTSKVIPTAVYYISENEYLIGYEAIEMSKLNPRGLVTSFKLDIAEDKTKRVVTFTDGTTKKISPRKVAQHYFQKLLLAIQNKLIKEFGTDGSIEKSVITVPAKFSAKQREKIKESAIAAGLQSVELACEPTAAAAAYQNDFNVSDDTILVYDFGGGTFDISIMKATKKDYGMEYEELSANGDRLLGGNDITNAIVSDILEQVDSYFGLDWELDEDKKGLYRMLDEEMYEGSNYSAYAWSINNITSCAEDIKIDIMNYSDGEQLEITIPIQLDSSNVQNFDVSYTRQEVESIISKYIDRTVNLTKKMVQYAKDSGIQIDKLVLAGGSSNIPMVQQALSSAISINIFPSDDFSSLISKGAVVISENINNKVTQITNHEYGIIVRDGRILDKFEPLIPINVKLPYSVRRPLYLNNDSQESLEFKIYERDIQNYPNSKRLVHEGIDYVYSVHVEDLPKGLRKSNTKINLNLTLQADGSIDISADLLVDDKMVSKLTITK